MACSAGLTRALFLPSCLDVIFCVSFSTLMLESSTSLSKMSWGLSVVFRGSEVPEAGFFHVVSICLTLADL